MARTQEEILARLAEVTDADWLGFRREVLIEALDYEHAKPYLNETTTSEQWAGRRDTETAARSYLEFAIEKILDHRGISATRSVEKLAEFAWLLGRDDVVAAMDSADYPQYGAPKVKAFATGMGWPWPAGDVALERMAAGQPCQPDCDGGCGW